MSGASPYSPGTSSTGRSGSAGGGGPWPLLPSAQGRKYRTVQTRFRSTITFGGLRRTGADTCSLLTSWGSLVRAQYRPSLATRSPGGFRGDVARDARRRPPQADGLRQHPWPSIAGGTKMVGRGHDNRPREWRWCGSGDQPEKKWIRHPRAPLRRRFCVVPSSCARGALGQATRLSGGSLPHEWRPDRRHRHGTTPRAPSLTTRRASDEPESSLNPWA